MNVASELQMKMLMLQDENSNMLEVAQREREKQWNSEVRHMILTNEAAESIDHQYQEKRMVKHLRRQLAIVKGSEMSMIAEMGNHDLQQKTGIQAYKLEISEREMRAQQLQYEARVMAETTKTMEDAACKIQIQAEEEQRQLREANFALTEANKVLRRENLVGTSAIDGRERVILEEKFQELKENHKIAERKLLEARSENAKMKAEMHHGFTRDESREGRGRPTARLNEESQSRLKADLKARKTK